MLIFFVYDGLRTKSGFVHKLANQQSPVAELVLRAFSRQVTTKTVSQSVTAILPYWKQTVLHVSFAVSNNLDYSSRHYQGDNSQGWITKMNCHSNANYSMLPININFGSYTCGTVYGYQFGFGFIPSFFIGF